MNKIKKKLSRKYLFLMYSLFFSFSVRKCRLFCHVTSGHSLENKTSIEYSVDARVTHLGWSLFVCFAILIETLDFCVEDSKPPRLMEKNLLYEFVNRFCLLLPLFAHVFVPVFVHNSARFCPLLPVFVNFYPFLPIFALFCPFLLLLCHRAKKSNSQAKKSDL